MRHYDIAFSIGARCVCSLALRNANLQFSSFPFDWVAGSTFDRRIRFLTEDFRGWITPEFLVNTVNPQFGVEVLYENRDTGMLFVHDFKKNRDFAEQVAEVQAKYARRSERLLQKIAAARRVLVVWVDILDERIGLDAARRGLEALRRKWPNVAFDFLVFKDTPGVGIDEAQVEETENVRIVRMDYHDPREQEWVPDHRVLTQWLKREYTATDYRTDEDKRTFKRHLADHEYARYAAAGWLDHLVTKYSYKLYKHLYKRLARKGII